MDGKLKFLKLSALIVFISTALYLALTLYVMVQAERMEFFSIYFAGRLDEYLRRNGIQTDVPDLTGSPCVNIKEKMPTVECTVFNSYSKNSLIGWDYLISGDWDLLSAETVLIWTNSQISQNKALMGMLSDFQSLFCVQGFENAPFEYKPMMCRSGKVRVYLLEFDPNMELVNSGYLNLKPGK